MLITKSKNEPTPKEEVQLSYEGYKLLHPEETPDGFFQKKRDYLFELFKELDQKLPQ